MTTDINETEETFRFTNDDVVKIISKDINSSFENSIFKTYSFPNYKFHELTLEVQLIKCTLPSSNCAYLLSILSCGSWKLLQSGVMLMLTFDEVEVAVRFLLTRFRSEYSYSKLIDKIKRTEDIYNAENLEIAKMILTSGVNDDDVFTNEMKCSICLETTLSRTKCNHPLCRICYYQMKLVSHEDDNGLICETKQCPLCRTCLTET